MILGGDLASELLGREDARIDGSPDSKLRLVKGGGELGETDVPNNHEIEITLRSLQ